MIGVRYHPPAFCGRCGNPHPWTSARLEAARVLVEDEERLSAQEKRQLIGTLPDLVRDVPMTQASGARYRRLAAKLGGAAAD